MAASALLSKLVFATVVGFSIQSMPSESTVISVSPNTSVDQSENASSKAAALVCKTGFKKGKTPVSLQVGGKVSCVNVKSAAAGKTLLTGMSNMCFACHGLSGVAPYNQMKSNLRTQGFTLKPVDIKSAFDLHASEMGGMTLTLAQAKSLSAFLQSIK